MVLAALYEVSIRFQHDCPFNDFSRKFPEARVAVWDNFQKEFVEVKSNIRKDWVAINTELENLAVGKGSKVLRKTSEGGSYQLMIMTCACERRGSTPDLIMKADCLFVPPITYYHGAETYHIVAFDKGSVKKLLDMFGSRGKVELAGQKRIEVETLDQSSMMHFMDPLFGLTGMQLNALVMAVALGYYRLPRRISTGAMAKMLHVPRTTFQEHRKKAESKLMAALAPYVLTYVGATKESVASPTYASAN